jgi:hypothetical protein
MAPHGSLRIHAITGISPPIRESWLDLVERSFADITR